MFIVTGGGSGIGKALSLELASRGQKVFICGRRGELLENTAQFYPQFIEFMLGDLRNDDFQISIVNHFKGKSVAGLVQCAAIIEPLSLVENMSLAGFKVHQEINIDAPLALFQKLRSKLSGRKVLHISSLAAHKPFAGWGAYCISKASLFMLYQLLKIECPDIAFGSVMPGITDTSMQEIIRQSEGIAKNDRAFFESLYHNSALLDPSVVAQFVAWLLLDVDKIRFSEGEWDIYDVSHHSQWLKRGEVPRI